MRVVLATASWSRSRLERSDLPPLSIGYLASYLESRGHSVALVDSHKHNHPPRTAAEIILSHKPDAVGISAYTSNRFLAIETIKEIKRRKRVFTFVGGPHFTYTARDALINVPEIDAVVCGEGEITAAELLEAWPDDGRMKDVAGIAYRGGDGRIRINPPRQRITDLDSLPMPAWHLFDLDRYRRTIDGMDIRAVGVISSRGCPFKCTFCVNAPFGENRTRLRNPKGFVDEVEFLHKTYGYEGFDFWDDTFTFVHKHLKGICQEIIDRRLDIKWYCCARVDSVNEEVIDLMRRAGCASISFGVESGSPRIIKSIKKRIKLEQVVRAAEICSEAGLLTRFNFMVSHPGETIEDMKLTMDLMKRLKRVSRMVHTPYAFTIILPGAELEAIAKRNGVMPPDFSWNSHVEFPKAEVVGTDPSLPYYENPWLKVEAIKAIISKELFGFGHILRRGISVLGEVRSVNDLSSFIRVSAQLLWLTLFRRRGSTAGQK